MKDINPIMTWLPVNIFYSIIFIFFVILLYFLWKYLEKNKSKNFIEKNIIKEEKIEKINFKEILYNFEKKYLTANKEIFYSKLAEILKYFLKQEKNIDILKMTYKEFSKINLDNKILNLLKNIYFKEYSQNIEDSEEVRKNLILEIKKLIK